MPRQPKFFASVGRGQESFALLTRIHRLLKLITLLQGGVPKSANELMEELGVSRRTLFRDLNALKEAGIPYFHEAREGYRLNPSFFLPPINLTVPETLGLMILTKTASGHRNRPLVPQALTAIYKIISSVPEPMRSVCAEMMTTVSVEAGPVLDSGDEATVYSTLQRCVDEQKACRIEYRSPAEATKADGEFHPYVLHHANRAWYVVGHSVPHGSVRMFKLVRFEAVERMEKGFNRPENFEVADYLGNAWALNPGEGTYDVELEFLPMVATNVSEVRWHKTQEHEVLPDGRCVMSFTVDGLQEIAWWVCGYADQVIIRKPDELRELVADMMRKALGHHEDDTT